MSEGGVNGGVFVHSTYEKSRQEGHKESKMMKYLPIYTLLSLFVFCTFCKGQNKIELPTGDIKYETKEVIISPVPYLSRNIIQDRKGNMWIAAFNGIFRYDGKSFTNITSKVSLSRFFSVLEDRKGNFWFGSLGSGVYYYDGKSFQNFTTREGLVNNNIHCIHEDKIGNIWFGTDSGASRYDGKSFQNYTKKEGLPNSDILSIIEDKTGKFWFGTRGPICIYDGKIITVLKNKDGKAFRNVWSMLEDKRGNIWFGGDDGLWRFDGSTFTNFTQNFVGTVYEDKEGNIWTGSTRYIGQSWELSRYDEKSLSAIKPTVSEIKSEYKDNSGMIFGILEAYDGNIWYGALDGVHRYDGNTITSFKDKEAQK
jgi:ligand-binding sensor domain-containing protein